MEIKLTYSEMLTAATIGVTRQIENLRDGRSPAYGAGKENDWQLHIEGAMGEMAVAKAMGLYWSKGGLRDDDVGNVQVRTRSKHNYELIIHHDDPDDRRFFLVTGLNGKYVVRGWIWGRDGKQDEFWSDPAGGRPAFFVPHSALTGDFNDH